MPIYLYAICPLDSSIRLVEAARRSDHITVRCNSLRILRPLSYRRQQKCWYCISYCKAQRYDQSDGCDDDEMIAKFGPKRPAEVPDKISTWTSLIGLKTLHQRLLNAAVDSVLRKKATREDSCRIHLHDTRMSTMDTILLNYWYWCFSLWCTCALLPPY